MLVCLHFLTDFNFVPFRYVCLGDSSIPLVHLLQDGSKNVEDVFVVNLRFPTRGAVGHPSMLPFLACQLSHEKKWLFKKGSL